MNVFYIDESPEKAAEYLVDRHVVKMSCEYAQLLSTAHRVLDGVSDDSVYKLTHKNHPSAIWVRESNNNYLWLLDHWVFTLREYTHRYEKFHSSKRLYEKLKNLPKNIPIHQSTQPPLCMPDEYKTNNAVDSYRNYYRLGKKGLHTWKNRNPPKWITEV